MKKDKNQHFTKQTTEGEPKISSAALTIQLLNKEKEKSKEAEKKESAAEAAKVRCRTCFKEIAPKRLCSGHGGGGGGSDSTTSNKTTEEKSSLGEDNSLTNQTKAIETPGGIIGEFGSEEFDLESSFDPEIIAELIDKGLLLVESDRESMTLTIKLLCDPNELTEEQREELKKFMTAIIKEFNEFKEENYLSDDCVRITQDEKGNLLSLRIALPTLALYDAFIQQLANNLVPIPRKAQEKDEVTNYQRLAPNPLSMEPKPSDKDESSKRDKIEANKDIDIEFKKAEEEKTFNPSPFNVKPWGI
ncbi:MAG TPA: hypothetical protein PK657_05160 [Legionella sp.]|nr:hypothetical protein [Legionella sp.]